MGWIRRWMMTLPLWPVLIAGAGPSALAASDQASIKFFTLENDGSEATEFSVAPHSELLLPFTWTVPEKKPKTFEFYVSAFRGQGQGNYITLKPDIVELPDVEVEEQRLTVSLDRSVITLRLEIPELPTTGKYEGQVVVLHEGHAVQNAALTLSRTTRQQPVELVIDRPAIPVTESPWPLISSPGFSVLVHNNSDWQAEGVFLRVMEASAPEDAAFDPIENLELYWNGKLIENPWRPASAEEVANGAARTIPAGKQAAITGKLQNLAAGEYTFKLGVAATNAASDKQPEATLKIRLRHSVVWALIVLLVAILVSFIATKGLETQRKRVTLLKKISQIRPSWLREEPPTLPVVAARAILKQAEARNKRWYAALFAPDIVSGRVDKSAQLIGLIRRVREIRKRIRKWNQDEMIRNRAEKRLDDKQVTEIATRLDELEGWLNSDKLYELYWVDLKRDIDNLVGQVRPDHFEEGDPRDVVTTLINRIGSQILNISGQAAGGTQQQNDLSDYIEIERDYAKLKILWERQTDNDAKALKDLAALLKSDITLRIDKFFGAADDIAWVGLKQACANGGQGLEFVSPRRSSIQPLQAYQLIEFEIAPKDPKLGNNYLFKHGLKYRWTLEIETEKGKKKGRTREVLTQDTSEEPRIIQYVPLNGNLYVSVQLRRNDDIADEVILESPLTIAKSGDFGWTGAFRFVEVMAFSIAAIFAVISGLGTFYFDAPVFGSVNDYITLFIWGAGVDQTKNFIQNLERASTESQPGS
jgi:hypothetical protein